MHYSWNSINNYSLYSNTILPLRKNIFLNLLLNTQKKVLKKSFCTTEARVLYGIGSCTVWQSGRLASVWRRFVSEWWRFVSEWRRLIVAGDFPPCRAVQYNRTIVLVRPSLSKALNSGRTYRERQSMQHALLFHIAIFFVWDKIK